MGMPKLIFLGNPMSLDMSDYMRKSTYDKDNDGMVDKIKKIKDIEEVKDMQPGKVIKAIDTDTAAWADPSDIELTEIDGGTL